MPTARESLLISALSAVRREPWSQVRMVDVADAAGVSRQTLYNEFGSKDGLSRALVRREVEAFLSGIERALCHAQRADADAGGCLAAAAAWTLRAAGENPLISSALTGSRDLRTALMPGAGRPTPTELVAVVRDHAVGAVRSGYPVLNQDRLRQACEAAVRLTLSYVVAPAATTEEAATEVGRLASRILADR